MGKIGNTFDAKTGLGHMVAREQALSVLFPGQRQLGSERKAQHTV